MRRSFNVNDFLKPLELENSEGTCGDCDHFPLGFCEALSHSWLFYLFEGHSDMAGHVATSTFLQGALTHTPRKSELDWTCARSCLATRIRG